MREQRAKPKTELQVEHLFVAEFWSQVDYLFFYNYPQQAPAGNQSQHTY